MDGSPSAVPVPICFRCAACAYFSFGVTVNIVLVTDPNLVTYLDNNGVPITMNSTDIMITNNGLLLNDPASSFQDGDSIRCNYNDGFMNGIYDITIDIFSEYIVQLTILVIVY